MENNLEIESYLSLEDACKYLDVDDTQLNLWISEKKLPVGLIARNWLGVAIPNPQETAGQLKIAEINKTDKDETQYLIIYDRAIDSHRIEQKVIECDVTQFWYLDGDSANSIVNTTSPRQRDIVFLRPVNAATLRAEQPEKFPFDSYLVELSQTYLELGIKKSDLRVLKSDLSLFKASLDNGEDASPNDTVHRFKKPKLQDEIFKVMEIYFDSFIEKNPSHLIDCRQLWSFMVENSPNQYFEHYPESNELRFKNTTGKKDTINLRSFCRRFDEYYTPN